MGNYQSGTTSITGSVTASVTTTPTLPTPGSTQTLIKITGTGNGSVQNAYTVTAGKTFYLFNAGSVDGASSRVSIFANDGTTYNWETWANITNGPTAHMAAFPIGVYTTAQVVKVNVTNGFTYYLYGVEI